MSGIPSTKNNIGNTIKLYLFPSLVTVLSLMIWRDINEMRADIKSLLVQSNIDKTRIDQLERSVRSLESTIYNKKSISYTSPVFERIYFKPEEVYDIKKYIPKNL